MFARDTIRFTRRCDSRARCVLSCGYSCRQALARPGYSGPLVLKSALKVNLRAWGDFNSLCRNDVAWPGDKIQRSQARNLF